MLVCRYGWSLLLIPRGMAHRIPATVNGYRVPRFSLNIIAREQIHMQMDAAAAAAEVADSDAHRHDLDADVDAEADCDDDGGVVAEAIGKIGYAKLARALAEANRSSAASSSTLSSFDSKTRDDAQDALKQWLETQLANYIAIDSSYLDNTHALPAGIDDFTFARPNGNTNTNANTNATTATKRRDTWANYYLPGPDAFWRSIVRDRLNGVPCVHLRCDDLWKHSATVVR